MEQINELVFDVLQEHLNDGCVDARCDFAATTKGVIEFGDAFLQHLTEEILDVLN